jgi:hypothetical protein
MSIFKVGQKVVCIDDLVTKIYTREKINILKNGKVYIITHINYCSKCNREPLQLKGVYLPLKILCICGTRINETSFRSDRFRPLQSDYNIISNKDIIKEIIKEKSDIPIKKKIPNLIPQENN